jgi:hypothetical protein
MRSFLLALVLSFVFLSYTSPVRADGVSVDFTAISLGSGTWQYDYTLQFFFSTNWGVAIYFPTPDYVGGSISDLGTGSSDWLTFAFQSDPTIPAPGEYDIVALVDNPSLGSVFDVTFQWNGTGTPGTQAFDLFDYNSDYGLHSERHECFSPYKPSRRSSGRNFYRYKYYRKRERGRRVALPRALPHQHGPHEVVSS